MIVRKEPDGQTLLVGQTDHSRLVGQFGAHWGNERFAAPEPFESVARAAAFHDFGWLRYETAPAFNPVTGETPNFREIPTDEKKLEEYRWCFEWFLGPDPYAGTIVSMHRTGLWRGRYDAIEHPAHGRRQQPPAVDAFVAEQEAHRAQTIAERAWDPRQVRTNYRLLQVWDLLGLYFACQQPYDDYIEPVPTSYSDADGEGTRMTLKPLDGNRVAFDPFPFNERPLKVQLAYRRLKQRAYPDAAAFGHAYFQAPLELLEFELV